MKVRIFDDPGIDNRPSCSELIFYKNDKTICDANFCWMDKSWDEVSQCGLDCNLTVLCDFFNVKNSKQIKIVLRNLKKYVKKYNKKYNTKYSKIVFTRENNLLKFILQKIKEGVYIYEW